jgi:arylsulfatase A-like enzyme
MMMKQLAWIPLIGVPVFATAAGSPGNAPKRPNVVFIYADDLGRGLLSFEGQSIIRTPHIDSLAASGISFQRVYGCMLSAPARASLLTGFLDCHPGNWQITDGGIYKEISTGTKTGERIQSVLDSVLDDPPAHEVFLPQVFKKAGYVTGEVGKLEWGFSSSIAQMERHGWDYYYGYLDHVRCHGFYPPFLWENGKMVDIPGNTRADCGKSREPESEAAFRERWNMTGKTTYSEDLFMGKILSFLRENKDTSFFLYFPTQLPHGPVSIPRIHPDFANDNRLTSIEKEYASMVKRLDDDVGTIVDELRKLGLAENTIVIFSADNGHEIYYSMKGRCEKPYRNMITGLLYDNVTDKFYSETGGDVFDGNDGMAGLKRSNWEGGVRVPLVVSWPGTIRPRVEGNALVSNADWLPTFADMFNIDQPEAVDGKSFLKILEGDTAATVHGNIVYSSFMGPAIVTKDGWKLRYYIQKDVFQLYDLTKDYREENNLIDRYPGRAGKLKSLLLEGCDGDYSNGLYGDSSQVGW